ncbi:MAG: hypothetical protein ACYS1A_03010 [Planctomycetota bacterium]|jgi:hypothetical protein
MSNRIDFFQSEQVQPAVAATTVSILLDGVMCPYLEPIEIVHGEWPEFSWARLVYNPSACLQGKLTSTEQIKADLTTGKTVYIRQVYNGSTPGTSAFSFPIFEGQIVNIESTLVDDGEKTEIIVRDFSTECERITVYGQLVANSDGSTLFLHSADTIFNKAGKANASIKTTDNNGCSYRLFCIKPLQARFWSYAEVIYYLFCKYLLSGRLKTPSLEQLRVLTEDQTVYDIDITGLNLLQALYRCCEKIDLKFKFVPRQVPTGPKQAIVFYRNAASKTVELNCQPKGEQFGISKTNIARLSNRKNFQRITHKYIGQGDFKVYEATFELVKAWDSANEDTDYDKFSPSTNPDFYKVKNVYRKWCLNEAGDYSEAPYNRGDVFDFSEIFTSDYFQRHRHFGQVLTTDKQNKSLGYFLQVSFDNGLHWWQYLFPFNNLPDECGIWLSSDKLEANTWAAAIDDTLRFRITATVISDERLSCEIADGPIDSVTPVVEHIISLPHQYKYRKVSHESIFADSSDNSLGVPDEVDDYEVLYEFVRKKAQVASEIIETINVQTPYLVFGYEVGDKVVSSPESRDLFGTRGDNRTTCKIARVQMDFENQCTNLKIVRQKAVV